MNNKCMLKKCISLITVSTLTLTMLTGCNSSTEQSVQEQTSFPVEVINPVVKDFSLTDDYIATVKAQNRVNIMPLVTGEVAEVRVNVGDYVNEGDVICIVDTEHAETQTEATDKAVSRANETYNNLIDGTYVKAPISGYVRSVDADLNTTIAGNSQLAFISDDKNMEIKIPFLYDEIEQDTIGKEAILMLTDTGETLYGTVSEISGAPQYLFGTTQVNYVTIDIENPGGLQAGRTATATIDDLSSSSSGNFVSGGSSPVIGGLSGTLEQIFVSNGDWVNAGDPMFQVINPGTQIQIDNALNAITDSLDSQEDAYEYLDDFTVVSPISGVISSVMVEEFDLLGSQSVVAEVVSSQDIEVSFNVPSSSLPYIGIGQEIFIEIGNEIASGNIIEISTVANQTGMFLVNANITDAGENMYTGTSVEVTVTSYTEKNALTIPFSAVQFEGDTAFVYLNESGAAIKTEIVVGEFNNNEIVVKEGLTADNSVITTWSSQLRDGASVNIIESEESEDVLD